MLAATHYGLMVSSTSLGRNDRRGVMVAEVAVDVPPSRGDDYYKFMSILHESVEGLLRFRNEGVRELQCSG